MIENRLCLNKKPVLNLPKMTMFRVQPYTHNIEEELKKRKPNVRICTFGANDVGKIVTEGYKSQEVWIITDNKVLIDRLLSFDWRSYALSKITGTPSLTQQSIKEEISRWKID